MPLTRSVSSPFFVFFSGARGPGALGGGRGHPLRIKYCSAKFTARSPLLALPLYPSNARPFRRARASAAPIRAFGFVPTRLHGLRPSTHLDMQKYGIANAPERRYYSAIKTTLKELEMNAGVPTCFVDDQQNPVAVLLPVADGKGVL